jgi:cytochrome c55X
VTTKQPQWKWRWWHKAVLAPLALALSPVQAAEPAPDAAKLTRLVRQDCGSCHGLTMKGGLGKPLTVDRLQQWDVAQLTLIILDGVPGTPMPPWRPLMSEADARWIAETLRQGNLQ